MTDHYNVISKQSAQNKRIVMRVDFNVPMQDGKILDDTRIKRVIPGIKTLLECSKQLILVTHLGRPKGNVDNTLSSQPIQEYLGKALSMPVRFILHIEDPSQLSEAVDSHDKICLLENCRFYAGEERNDQNLARAYASLADIYVNDAFSCSHRSHASIQAITGFLPSYAGPVLAAELTALSDVLESPKRPVAAFVGGAKISTKLSVLENLISKVDKLLLAGAMANTFLAAKQIPVAASLYEPDLIPTAKMISELAQQQGCEIILPVDGVVSTKLKKGGRFHTRLNGALEDNEMILDIGPASVALFKEHIKDCKTILWNGPAGYFENPNFANGSIEIAKTIIKNNKLNKIFSVVGGGDTVSLLNSIKAVDGFNFVSTAGGAFLEYLEGKKLPGIKALNQ